jgi:NAD(P)-dependent dehydrogenase (short-subunit alcohol dehydrogenase family)
MLAGMTSTNEFTDRVAIVTGASSGIGRATVEMLVARGALVVLFARSRARLEVIVAGNRERTLAVAGDVADEESIERLFAETESRFGDCHLLVNSAGMIEPRPLQLTSPTQWERTFAVNMRGTFLATRRALPAMAARRSGAIVNVSSISGVLGPEKFPGFVSYAASKAAVIGFTEALGAEVKDLGVRVNCVSPGSVDTPMWAAVSGGAPASMTPEQVGETILFLLSERSAAMNGRNLEVW